MTIRSSLAVRLSVGALLLVEFMGPFRGAVPAGASREAASTDTLVVAYPGAPQSTDPSLAYDNTGAAVLRGPYESLVTMAGVSTTKVKGVLATSWSANADSTVWTFHLRHGVLFHDATPFNSAAVKASITRTLALNGGPSYIYGQYLTAADVLTPDPYTVVFHLRTPAPRLLFAMASQWGNWIFSPTAVAKHTVKKDYAQGWLATHDAGTGPYMISQYTANASVTMVKFPEYWGGWSGNHVSAVIVSYVSEDATRRALVEKGDADISNLFTPQDIAAMKQNPALVADTGKVVANWTLTPTVSGPFVSAKARLALSYTFDYNGFINGLLKGLSQPALGPILHTVDGWDASLPPFKTDLTKAKQLFTEAGVTPAGTKLTIWYTSEDETTKDVALIAQGQLEQLGFSVSIVGRDAATFGSAWFGTEPISQRPNLWVTGWSGDYNDTYAWFEPLYHSKDGGLGGSGNAGLYKDATVDKLIAEATVELNTAKRHQLDARIQQILTYTDPATTPIAEELNSTVYRKSLHGYYYNPIDVLSYNYYAMWK